MDAPMSQSVSSRSASPEEPAKQTPSPISHLPPPVEQFFKSVSQDGFPSPKGTRKQDQPWRKHWNGPQKPTEDGRLIVACPKQCTYGSNNLGGL